MAIQDEEKDEIEFYNRYTFADLRDIKFGMWLGENGWQFYDGEDRLINVSQRNLVLPITELFADFKKENPEP